LSKKLDFAQRSSRAFRDRAQGIFCDMDWKAGFFLQKLVQTSQ
jgi:hypothetical protein